MLSSARAWLKPKKADGGSHIEKVEPPRCLSLSAQVQAAGSLAAWNAQPNLAQMQRMLAGACQASTVEEALAEIRNLMGFGTKIWAYMYLRKLFERSPDIYYSTLLRDPALLLPVAYTPTVGEACQRFGHMPLYARGCYVSLRDRGNVRAVLVDYARKMLGTGADGRFECECIVFTDGGRILGLGDLGTFGMGIPIGKLDLYTVCGGFDPEKTIPVVLDAGCSDASGNSAKLTIRDGPMYTGLVQDRVKHKSDAGTDVNSCYYGEGSFIREFMSASRELFGPSCLLQFEDFNSNDAFPLLSEYREEFLTYNDDIQGTAAVTVAALLGAIKVQRPECTALVDELRGLRVLFHGAGSANLGSAALLVNEAKVPPNQLLCTNSRGVVWRSEDGSDGSFRNEEQKAFAQVGRPGYDSRDLALVIQHFRPDALIGAVGVDPGCFTKQVVEAMARVQAAKPGGGGRPVIFALSNPKTQAEISAMDCYGYSDGKAIYGSGTRFAPVEVDGKTREPGQVNNFLIFPGLSFGAMRCAARTIPESFFMAAAEAVANSLDAADLEVESVVPHVTRIRQVAQNVATAVVLKAQADGLASKPLGDSWDAVAEELRASMWSPFGV